MNTKAKPNYFEKIEVRRQKLNFIACNRSLIKLRFNEFYLLLLTDKIMDYTVTYKYKNKKYAVLLQNQHNILGAIGQFYEDHKKGCEIIKIELY